MAKIVISFAIVTALSWLFFIIGEKSAINNRREVVAEAMRILRVEYCSDKGDSTAFNVITKKYFSDHPSFRGLVTINPEILNHSPSSINEKLPIAWGLLSNEEFLVLYGDNKMLIEDPDV